ncbi:MAG: GNAT family N-acetyltransferase [Pseudomonadota bacterium]
MLKPVFRAGETYAIDPGISEVDALSYWTGADAGAFVIEDAGCALGTYYIRTNQPGGGSHVCNCGFITAQGTAGKGVARAMLEDALVRAKTAGFTAMQFNFVLANNTRAIDIWTRAGFDTVGRLPGAFDHPKDGLIDALVMYRHL